MSEQDSSELGNILNQENLILEQVTSILRVAQKQQVKNKKLGFYFKRQSYFGSKSSTKKSYNSKKKKKYFSIIFFEAFGSFFETPNYNF